MEIDLNNVCGKNAYIIAPAGCGKTESIVNIVKTITLKGKMLILTHTNAGIDSILSRLEKYNVPRKKYNIYTIASFCSKYVNAFSYNKNEIENLEYEDTYRLMLEKLKNNNIINVISYTYSQIFVDEYQDCTLIQHDIIKSLSKRIPCLLFGDPLQGIFSFKDNKLVDMEKDLQGFEYIGNLEYPWRWKNNLELGNWILSIRKKLLKHQEIELENLPKCVKYVEYDNDSVRDLAFELLKKNNISQKVFLFKHKPQAEYFSKSVGGKYSSQEKVECSELAQFCKNCTGSSPKEIILEILALTKLCFSNFNNELGTINNKIKNSNFNCNRINKNKNIYDMIVDIINDFKCDKIINFMESIEKNNKMNLFRKELWNKSKMIISLTKFDNMLDCYNKLINNMQLRKKFKYNNLSSRVLLVKGLEYNTVIVVEPEKLTFKEFYVAISRPTINLFIVSKSKKINFFDDNKGT